MIFGCEDGYLYVLGHDGKAPLPRRDLGLEKVRSALTGKYADAKFDWFTNYGNLQNTNANDQGVKPPLKIKWLRRYKGTFKHLPVCGGGRMYTHTSEGQVFAVEQETTRLLWRKYWPGVYLSFTSPIYFRHGGKERLLVPQAGMRTSRLRCLDAATGEMLWEVPFTGSPSWSRQAPPVIHKTTFFGYSASLRKRRGLPDGPNGLAAQLDPATSEVQWMTTKHHVTAGCTISAHEGRLYVGGYNQPDSTCPTAVN